MYAKVDVDAVVIRHVRPFGLMDGCYRATWRTGWRRRSTIVLIEDWPAAEQTIVDAVRSCYPATQQLDVRLPRRALAAMTQG